MLEDQMGLVYLLYDELPEYKNEAEAIANLAFNVGVTFVTILCSQISTVSDIQQQQPTPSSNYSQHCIGPSDNCIRTLKSRIIRRKPFRR